MPHLSGITVYPIKSLDPVSVPQARLTAGGGLEHDREWALVDAEGRFVNAKRTPLIHGLQASVDRENGLFCVRTRDGARGGAFHGGRERARLEAWLSDYFGLPVALRRDTGGGFPDDAAAPGPTLIGEATLREVAAWHPDLDLCEARVRFRANLEIADAPPFWEDRLFGAAGEAVRFRVGDVVLEGTNPCQRCIVPTRHSQTGAASPDFARVFRARREATLPAWADRSRFNHFYRLAVNTRVPPSEEGKTLRVGDEVRLL